MQHDWTLWLSVAALALTAGVIVVLRPKLRKLERAELRSFTDQFGFRPLHGDEILTGDLRDNAELFRRGVSHKARNGFEGSYKGRTFRVFEYRYRIGVPWIASIRYWQTVIALPLAGPESLAFMLAPARDGYRGWKTVRWQKHAFPDSQGYVLLSPQSEQTPAIAASDLIALLRQSRVRQLTVEAGGRWLLLFRKGFTIRSVAWPAMFDLASQLAERLPMRAGSS